jgi:hypothetical protein
MAPQPVAPPQPHNEPMAPAQPDDEAELSYFYFDGSSDDTEFDE